MKTLEQHSPAQINEEATRLHRLYGAEGGLKAYRSWISQLRRECFERLAAAMDPEGQLAEWEGQMVAKHGPKVQVHGVTYSWKAALGVVRFGEDPNALHPDGAPVWPKSFSADDVIRANRWLYQGNTPEGVTYITAEG